MKSITSKFYIPLLAVLIMGLASCGSMSTSPDKLISDAEKAQEKVAETSNNLEELFQSSAGYAIFPNVGKGAYILGGASGNGVLYENGSVQGFTEMKQVDVGLQIGGKAYTEVLFFQSESALEEFKSGDYELTASASAVILEKGKSASVDFQDGVGVVIMPKAGAMAGVSVGGQKFEYRDR
ncbi:lipid-binding SYLF domain-containing protein [Salegentibacter sp. F188]|uniref:Lipid-binding SYLF domain-containing protein n=1 Tax=Autumnicola patrickiae TaxID=3075591 RepID=A0ABU3E6H4_9FLAO|nr:lipid-binding SYLF domain-containing protein [Salegentibacter sp. F188]MDT0690822.1 lipid-binding SYLF domain-containing protein [Salegentibacter sp. F188]